MLDPLTLMLKTSHLELVYCILVLIAVKNAFAIHMHGQRELFCNTKINIFGLIQTRVMLKLCFSLCVLNRLII